MDQSGFMPWARSSLLLHLLNWEISLFDSTIAVSCGTAYRTGRRPQSSVVLSLLNSDHFYVWQHNCCGLRNGPADWEKNEEFSCKADGDLKCSVPNSCCTDQKVGWFGKFRWSLNGENFREKAALNFLRLTDCCTYCECHVFGERHLWSF